LAEARKHVKKVKINQNGKIEMKTEMKESFIHLIAYVAATLTIVNSETFF
jgi:hypothetical protein